MEQQHHDPGQVSVRHKFTTDELRALKECNRESFYYRCLPIGTAFTFATWYAVKNGYLKASPRFGATPKMFAAAILGYFAGKFSYQSACIDKLMQLPNSQLAEQLRQRRGLPSRGGDLGGGGEGGSALSSFPSFMPTGMTELPSDDQFSPQNVFTDVGDTRPLDSFDTEHSRQELVLEEDIPLKPATKTTTYDELRRANRDEFYKGRASVPAPAPPASASPPPRQQPVRDERAGGSMGMSGKSVVKNQYGDVWEKTD